MLNEISKKIDKLKVLLFGYRIKKCIIQINLDIGCRILYNVHNSLPETSNGYAIRSHTIAKAIKAEGIDISVVTRVGFPIDIEYIGENKDNKKVHIVNDIEYNRLQKKGLHLEECTLTSYIENYTNMLINLAKKKKATIIHSASSYINGLAGVSTANILGLPSVYEVRGFWEITRASREPEFKDSLGYKLQKKLEIQACKEATSVIALSEVVKEELINRGIEDSKIYVIPNGVDTNLLKPIKKDENLINKLDFKDKFIVGFIGSVVDYEGLKLLVEAAENIEKIYTNKFLYLIVGDGNDLDNIKQLVKKLEVEKLFVFTGRVAYEEVEKYYSIIDIACYPRLDWEVCRIVSPKKPFEAMAYCKPIVSSSVRANSYFIEHGINGLIHEKENIESIVENILKFYEDKELYEKISRNAREWVVENRDSKMTGKLLKEIYIKTQEKFYKI